MRAFRLAYDGRGYHGFQRQPDVETIEGALFDALQSLGVLANERSDVVRESKHSRDKRGIGGPTDHASGRSPRADDETASRSRTMSESREELRSDGVLEAGERKPEDYAAAGRTDKGVSALCQTVAFRCPEWCTPRALNAELPAGVRAWAAADVSADFHATHDATAREYTYYFRAPGADCEVARTVLDRLSGTHDFHNLTPNGEGTERTLEASLEADGNFLVCRFRAGGFPRQLVRRAVSLVRDVAVGERPLAHVDRVLSEQRLDGPAGVGPAPAHPLVLTDVEYPDIEFAVDEEAAASAREVFEARRVEHETRAHVTGTVAEGVR